MAEQKHPGGRPPKLTPVERKEVLEAFRLYIERTVDPTIVGFCAWDPVGGKYLITKDDINHWGEFSELRKYAIQKQEAYMLSGAVTNKLNATMAIFRLKQPQHGYKDRFDTDITSGGEKLETGLDAARIDQLIHARGSRADLQGSSD